MTQAIIQDRMEFRAYLADAEYHIARLRSVIVDSLTGSGDDWLRASLMDEVDAISLRIAKAKA